MPTIFSSPTEKLIVVIEASSLSLMGWVGRQSSHMLLESNEAFAKPDIHGTAVAHSLRTFIHLIYPSPLRQPGCFGEICGDGNAERR